jgi:group II intron reverse transcriptase/maturase
MSQTKPIEISKHEVEEAYKRVKANKGSAGIDHQSLKDFDADKCNNLYKLWNRMSSGSYIPPPVLRVEIPKGDGGTRALGIPTITDRIAQMVVKQRIEPELEQHFHPNSYGYRPNKSALEAVALTRERCWKRAWVLDMDIKGFFDEINHDLLMQAVNKHVPEKWMKRYIERWLKAPVQHRDEQPKLRDKGTPQGGVISPLLANLYLHYVFDTWVEKHWTGIQFERYADDIVCHCASEQEAQQLKTKLEQRFTDCGLTLHPKKTKIAYCKSSNNRGSYPQVSFDFLGHTFKPRLCKNKQGKFFVAFTPAISRKSAKKVRDKIASWPILRNSKANLNAIAYYSRAILQGWKNYYGKYGRAELKRVLFYLNEKLVRWAKKKYKRLKTERRAVRWIIGYRQREPKLFVHWSFT